MKRKSHEPEASKTFDIGYTTSTSSNQFTSSPVLGGCTVNPISNVENICVQQSTGELGFLCIALYTFCLWIC